MSIRATLEDRLARVSEDGFYLFILAFFVAISAALATCLELALQRNFQCIAIDTALLQSAIVNTMHGNFFGNNGPGGPNILALHTMFVLLLFVPIYALLPSPDTLFVLQVCGIYSTIFPIYLIASQVLKSPRIAFCIAFTALVSPFLVHLSVAPFHPETWIVAAVFWSYYFYLRNNLVGYWVAFIFACSCAEQAALIYVAIGAALLLVNDDLPWCKRFGRHALIGGVIWFVAAVEIVLPLFRTPYTSNLFAFNYPQWKVNSASGLVIAVVKNPLDALGYMVDFSRWKFFAQVVGIPIVFAFLSWRSLPLMALLPLYFLMSDRQMEFLIHAYYFSFAFVAGYLGIIYLLRQPHLSQRMQIVVFVTVLFFNVLDLGLAMGTYLPLALTVDTDLDASLHKIFATISPQAAVYSPHRFSGYLSNRQTLVIGDLSAENPDFDAMLNARFAETNVRPDQISYIVCDTVTDQCGPRMPQYSADTFKKRGKNINNLMQTHQWEIIFNESGVVVLMRIGR